MRAFVERHRHLSLLVGALLAQLFFLAYQIKTESDVRLLRVWAVAVITPVEKLVRGAVGAAGSLSEDYLALYGARQESHRLRAELEQAQLRMHELETRAAEADELAALLDFKQSYSSGPLMAARVIGVSPGAATRTVLIDRGREAGLEVNMVVLTPTGLVGKVVTVFPGAAQVLLITDQKSGVGVQVGDTQLQGIVKGTGGSVCRLEYISNEEPVAVGAEVFTSGQDQLFPKGLPVGRVVSAGRGEFFQEITVQPAASLTRLEHVLVVARRPEPLTTTAQGAEAEGRVAR